jgi:PAS domain S-box-containing protein
LKKLSAKIGGGCNLLKSEKLLDLVFDAIQDGISILDKDLNVIRVNKIMRQLYSHKLPFEGIKKCFEVYHDRSKPCEICPTLRAFKSGKLEVNKVPLTSKQGVVGTLELFSFPIIDESGNVQGVVEHVRDITAQVKAIEDLSESEKRYKTLFKSANDAIFILDMKGNIIDTNSVAYERLGYTKEEILALNITQLDHPKFAAKVPERLGRIQKLGKVIFESAHIKKDGSIMPVEISASLINLKGKEMHLSVVRDITIRKQLEEELMKVKKLESIGFLAGGIAHDFNNILAAILGNINLAAMDTNLLPKTKKFLEEAEKGSFRARDLTQQLLTFAKGGEPIKEVSSFESVIKDSANFVLHGDKVACRYDIPKDLWLVDIDKGQMSQVIQNIVLNASHAMPEGGTIQITCENIDPLQAGKAFLDRDKKFVEVTITDSGIGIPANVIDKIFDPYFSTKQKGSGLGLAISHSIVTKHNGHIAVKSTPGAGTTFTIYLPASVDQPEQEKREEPIVESNVKAKIMVMDDEEMVRDVAQSMLHIMEHEVVLAQDGAEAIALYREYSEANEPIDIVIMDLTIPGGMGGKDTVKEVLAFNPEAKVIVSSGYSNDPIMANFQKFGFCAAIEKPYQFKKLSEVINQVMAQRKQ